MNFIFYVPVKQADSFYKPNLTRYMAFSLFFPNYCLVVSGIHFTFVNGVWKLELSSSVLVDIIIGFFSHEPVQILDQRVFVVGGWSCTIDIYCILSLYLPNNRNTSQLWQPKMPLAAKSPLVENQYIIINPYNLTQFSGLMITSLIKIHPSVVIHRHKTQ